MEDTIKEINLDSELLNSKFEQGTQIETNEYDVYCSSKYKQDAKTEKDSKGNYFIPENIALKHIFKGVIDLSGLTSNSL